MSRGFKGTRDMGPASLHVKARSQNGYPAVMLISASSYLPLNPPPFQGFDLIAAGKRLDLRRLDRT